MSALETVVEELKTLPPKKFAAAADYVHRLTERSHAGNGHFKKKISSKLHPDIRRLTGLAPADWDAKAIYHEHVITRHA